MKSEPDIAIRAAYLEERSAAFSLALQHLGADICAARLQNALALVADGIIAPGGILVAPGAGRLRGVQICVLLPGASVLFWLPRTEPANEILEDHLVQSALDWARSRGAKVAQAIISPLDRPFVGALRRRGFCHVTNLQYFEHSLENLSAPIIPEISHITYYDDNRHVFQATLLRTYQETLDCPELNGIRTVDEIIAGHQAQGVFRPERWLLAWKAAQPVAVAMLAEIPDLGAWDLSYLGVVPEARRRGLGRELATLVLHLAKKSGAPKVLLAVDERNQPAIQLYQELGFLSLENRDIYLYFWDRPLAGSKSQSPESQLL
jgi:mycothiol synthase